MTRLQLAARVAVVMGLLGTLAAGLIAWWLVWALRILHGGPLGGWVPMVAALLTTVVVLFLNRFMFGTIVAGAGGGVPPSAGEYVVTTAFEVFAIWFMATCVLPFVLVARLLRRRRVS